MFVSRRWELTVLGTVDGRFAFVKLPREHADESTGADCSADVGDGGASSGQAIGIGIGFTIIPVGGIRFPASAGRVVAGHGGRVSSVALSGGAGAAPGPYGEEEEAGAKSPLR